MFRFKKVEMEHIRGWTWNEGGYGLTLHYLRSPYRWEFRIWTRWFTILFCSTALP